MSANSESLRISEIFFSLQGETRTTGLPTVFVRLTGCPLRCHYCDTTYAFTGGEWMSIDEIICQVSAYEVKYVTITGGEPLAQKNCNDLMSRLCDANHEVSLETSGAVSVADVDSRVVKVIDIKTPGSGEVEKNLYENFKFLDAKDEIKFVICNEEDYDWCKGIINQYQLSRNYQVLFSPSHEELEAGVLADWILRDKLSVRLQIQLHKYLWGNVPGR
jgi:7-carboxy-7-deazaguanine synthase